LKLGDINLAVAAFIVINMWKVYFNVEFVSPSVRLLVLMDPEVLWIGRWEESFNFSVQIVKLL